MTKSLKQRADKFIFTTARLHMVRRGLDDEQTYAEIAERLGTTRQLVRQAAEREGWAVAVAYQVVGENKAEKQTKEHCERAASPEVWTFTQGMYPVAGLPPFDIARLVEKPNVPPKEGQ